MAAVDAKGGNFFTPATTASGSGARFQCAAHRIEATTADRDDIRQRC
jgi:hypothetical protein